MLVHRLLSATFVLASFVLAFPFPPLDNSGSEIINPDGPGISGTSGNTATTKPRTHTHSSPSFRRGYSAYDLPVFAQRYKRSPSDIKLIGDRILVRMSVPAADCSHVKEKPHEGVVLAVGPGKKKPMDVKVGDKVLFSKYGGTEIKVEGEECLLLAERDILALG